MTLRGYQLDRVACIPGGAIVALSGAKVIEFGEAIDHLIEQDLAD